MDKDFAVIGKSLPLKDAYEKVTGKLKFSVDYRLEGMLHAKVLRSPYPHAKIVKIDTGKAEAFPGVEAIITHKDVPPEEWMAVGFNYRGRVLDERVRFVGDEVAAVAAINPAIAEEALHLIDVEYEELPAVFDIEKAMKPGAPLVCPHGNVRDPSIVEWGDIERGFKDAEVIVEHQTRMGNQSHAPLEPGASIASWEGDKLPIWAGTQTPFQMRDEIARLLKMPQSKVRVIMLPAGGSFGLYWINNFNLIPIFLSKKAKKPVKLELTREEVFTSTKRREAPISWAKLGLKKNGSFTAIHFRHHFDNGGYGFKSDPYQMVADLWGGKTPHGKFECYGISTNQVTAGCMRGVGDVTLTFCMEQVIDKAAEELGMDPIEIRLKNHIRTGEPLRMKLIPRYKLPTHTHVAFPPPPRYLSSCGLEECIRRGAELIGWDRKWKGWGQATEVRGGKKRGLGMGVAQHVCSIRTLGTPGAVVKINYDGSVNLFTGAGCMGQGLETTQAQIAAEELGVPPETIVGVHGDTETCPWCVPIYANLGTHELGTATKAAAADAKRQVLEIASRGLGVRPEELDMRKGVIYVKAQPEKKLALDEITSALTPETLSPPNIIGRAAENVPHSPQAAVFLAHFAEVEVDTETGKIEVLKYVAVHDSGKIINQMICENQVASGVRQGCGLGLVENLIFDKDTGQVLNPNFVDYKILRALDMPDPVISFVETEDPVGPFGAKGLGEATVDPGPAVVAQAVYNAIGVRFNNVPITPEMVLTALKTKGSDRRMS
jgi:CO/xanthine dehydrogenase Mo-binding subunit